MFLSSKPFQQLCRLPWLKSRVVINPLLIVRTCKIKGVKNEVLFTNKVTGRLYHSTSIQYLSSKKTVVNSDTKVFVIDSNDEEIGEMAFNEAQVMASEANMKLVAEKKHKHTKVVYKLKEVKAKNKELRLKDTIAEHDLQIKIKQTAEWLKKGATVDVIILHGRGQNKQASVLKKLSDSLKDLATFGSVNSSTDVMSVNLIPKNIGKKSPKPELFTTDELKGRQS